MAQDPLVKALQQYKSNNGKALRIGLVNTGGTFTCIENEQGLLNPVQTREELDQLLYEGLYLGIYRDLGLLEFTVIHHGPMDSSQMTDVDRTKFATEMGLAYSSVDGFIVIHGTDSAEKTAKYLTFACPYFDPIALWEEDKNVFNWRKPNLIVSSQLPALTQNGSRFVPKLNSDAPMNISVALMLIAEGKVGEPGLLTNNTDIVIGSASMKGAEISIPPYMTDPAVGPVAVYTASGLRYPTENFLPANIGRQQKMVPRVITCSVPFSQTKVLPVQDQTHLSLVSLYLNATELHAHIKTLKRKVKPLLPEIILYESAGAGNVAQADYAILKAIQQEGIAFKIA